MKDPLLQGAVSYNLLTERVDIVKTLWWKKQTATLTDTDLNYLMLYLEDNYALTSEKKIQKAISIVADCNKYHPIRDYLNSLEWDGTERIRYLGVTLNTSGVVTALTNCVRGYHSTTAASHAAAASISLKSRVYIQDKCRPTCSVWIQNDHTVMFASGCVVTSVAVPQSKTGGQHCDFTFQFRQLGWAGRSFLGAIPSTGVLSVVTAANVAAGGAYTVGAIVKNTTKNDDNSGAGYTVTAVDTDNGTITVSPVPTGWAKDDQIDAWLPEADPIGVAL